MFTPLAQRVKNAGMNTQLTASLCLVLGASLAQAQVAVEFVEGSGFVTGFGSPLPAEYETVPIGRRGAEGGGSTGSGFVGSSRLELAIVDVVGTSRTNLIASGNSSHFSTSGGSTTSTGDGTIRLASPVRVQLTDLSRRVVRYSDSSSVTEPIGGEVTLAPAESAGRLIGSLANGILFPGDYVLSAQVTANGTNVGFPNTRSSTLSWTLAMSPLTPRLLASTDATSDGSDDIFFHHTLTGVCVAWTRTVTNQTTFSILGGAAPNWEIRGTGDLSLDGVADIVWQNVDSGEVGLWITRAGQFAEWRSLGVPPAGFRVEAVGDFDGDFQNDLIFRNTQTGVLVVWLMNATSLRTWQVIAAIPTDWQIVTAGDWTGDGESDLLCYRASTGDVGVLGMNDTQIISWSGIGFADPAIFRPFGRMDTDGNGTQELLWQDQNTGRFAIWTIQRLGTTAAFDSWSPFFNPLVDSTWRARN